MDNPVRARKVPGSKLTTLRILEEQHFGSLTCHVLRSKVSLACYVSTFCPLNMNCKYHVEVMFG